ncbi:prefoldin subunit beta [Candidatus Woesearchaeota archaeon]|nr:prefoldin subunit beta [Candidatus Woesearchaeota archaeon]
METEEKIGQLQLLEQNLQNISAQKQNFQAQLLEIENAMEELGKSKGKIYKIIGSVMIASEKKDLEKDLNSKKEIIELRVKSFEKQENKLREKFTETQEEVLKELKNKEG